MPPATTTVAPSAKRSTVTNLARLVEVPFWQSLEDADVTQDHQPAQGVDAFESFALDLR